MSYTKFGEFIRILRVKNHEVMGDTANLLGVKVPFVSAVENGKRNVPETWFDILVKHYNLSAEEQEELKVAMEDSKTQAKINLISAPEIKRATALQFQRSFEKMDDETAEAILKILNKEGD